jgi:hypothetical protein
MLAMGAKNGITTVIGLVPLDLEIDTVRCSLFRKGPLPFAHEHESLLLFPDSWVPHRNIETDRKGYTPMSHNPTTLLVPF